MDNQPSSKELIDVLAAVVEGWLNEHEMLHRLAQLSPNQLELLPTSLREKVSEWKLAQDAFSFAKGGTRLSE